MLRKRARKGELKRFKRLRRRREEKKKVVRTRENTSYRCSVGEGKSE